MPASYSNPILCGFHPDPSICRVGEDFYLVCSSFAFFPGLPVFHSRDLVHWNLLSHAIDRSGAVNFEGLGVSKGMFAPTLRYFQGRFFLTCTFVDGGGNFVITASDPAGPWSDPVWLPIDGIDPSPFFDPGGGAWMIYNSVAPGNRPDYDGHRTIRMRAFEPDTLTLTGEELLLIDRGDRPELCPRWIEGPHLYFREGWYYLLAAQGGTGYDHAVVAFRSRELRGPYHSCIGNPLLCGDRNWPRSWPITSAGHADLVDTLAGDWQAVFLATRPYEGDHYNTGRETFLVPVSWNDEGPVINPGHSQIDYAYPLPLRPSGVKGTGLNGNFSLIESFSGDTLPDGWIHLREPVPEAYHFRKPGLGLSLSPDTLAGRGRPSFLARRQQHLHFEAWLAMRFRPKREGERAGLAVFQDSNHFYFISLELIGNERMIVLHRSLLLPQDEAATDVLAAMPAPESDGVRLRVEGEGREYRFSFRGEQSDWTLLPPALDARFLSTATAGGFTGCVVGVYATSRGGSTAVADVLAFGYTGRDEVFQQGGEHI